MAQDSHPHKAKNCIRLFTGPTLPYYRVLQLVPAIPAFLLTAAMYFLALHDAHGNSPSDFGVAMRASKAAIETYRQEGMSGLISATHACYGRARKIRNLPAAQYCYTLDAHAAFIDMSFSAGFGILGDENFTEEARDERFASLMQAMNIHPNRQEKLRSAWYRHLRESVRSTTELLDAEGEQSGSGTRTKPHASIKPDDLSAPWKDRTSDITKRVAQGTLQRQDAIAVGFSTFAEARDYADSDATGLLALAPSIAATLEKNWTWFAFDDFRRANTTFFRKALHIRNVTKEQIDTLTIEVSDKTCDKASKGQRRYFNVRRTDGYPILPDTEIALTLVMRMGEGMFGPKLPGGWCATIIGASRAAEVPHVDEADTTPMQFVLRKLKMPAGAGFINAIHATGDIVPGTMNRLQEFIRDTNPRGPTRLVLNSNGGVTPESLRIGYLVRKLGWSTDVGRLVPVKAGKAYLPGGCYSACSLIYAAGTVRYLEEDSIIGVHWFRLNGPNKKARTLEYAKDLTATLLVYSEYMGVSSTFIRKMAEVANSDMFILTANDLKSMNLVTGSTITESWGLTPTNERLALKGKVRDELASYSYTIQCSPATNTINAQLKIELHHEPPFSMEKLVHSKVYLLLDDELVLIPRTEHVLGVDPSNTELELEWKASAATSVSLRRATRRFGLSIHDPLGPTRIWFAQPVTDEGAMMKAFVNNCIRN